MLPRRLHVFMPVELDHAATIGREAPQQSLHRKRPPDAIFTREIQTVALVKIRTDRGGNLNGRIRRHRALDDDVTVALKEGDVRGRQRLPSRLLFSASSAFFEGVAPLGSSRSAASHCAISSGEMPCCEALRLRLLGGVLPAAGPPPRLDPEPFSAALACDSTAAHHSSAVAFLGVDGHAASPPLSSVWYRLRVTVALRA